ncbi:thiamine diphosphokinase [Bifidobacterium stellenboschense]|uniref:Thiamine diphosphokinase n=1 Tax=Bifidobacterium stellenboschense TaxID=762211 RepID=A0A087E048_9BIFI|nr:thiamine diphosphokinase [Bifidobacterium stellenboschense]KFJ01149.1 thiamine pyrophosphokinase [Bifidobacterium stellenboschense]
MCADIEGRVCVVFAAGEYYASPDYRPIVVPGGAFVVAADGGLDHARAAGVSPDVVVGDFDSLEGARPAAGADTIALPPLKDDPDLLSALKVAWSRGCRTFHVYGALGGRIDHTLSAIRLMALVAHHGGIGFLHGDGTIVTAICDARLDFPANDVAAGHMVSVFSHSDVSRGVNEPGLKYEMLDGTLTSDAVQGVSNEFRPGVPASVGVREGTLVVTFPAEAPMPRVARRHAFGGDLGTLDTRVSPLLRG